MHGMPSFLKQASLHPADDECSPDYCIIVLKGQLIAVGSGGHKTISNHKSGWGFLSGMRAQELSVSSP